MTDRWNEERLNILKMSRDRIFLPPPTPVSRRVKPPLKHELENAIIHLSHHAVDTHLHPGHYAHYKNIIHHTIGESGNTKLTDEAHEELLEKLFGKNSKTIANALKINKNVNEIIKKLDAKPSLQVVKEPVELHKYGALADSAYAHYNGEDPTSVLKSHFLEELNDFIVDEELSTPDNLVLHNPITKETHMAFRGTQKLSDWKTNLQAMSSIESHSPLVKSALKTADAVAAKYGTKYLTTSGHSMGAMRSLEVTHYFGSKGIHIPGFHFDPGTSIRQMIKSNFGLQKIFRTHFDTPSIIAKMAQLKPAKNLEINNVYTNPEHETKVPGLDQHSTNHFKIKFPIGLTEDGKSVLVKRHTAAKVVADALRTGEQGINIIGNSKVGQLAKPALHYGSKILEKSAAPLAVLGIGIEAYNDITDPNKSTTEKEVDVGIDTATGAAAWTAGNITADLAMAATLALCPECAMVGLVGSLAVGGATGYAIEKAGSAIKKPAEKVVGVIEDKVESGERAFGRLEDEITGTKDFAQQAKDYDVYDLGDDIKSGAKKLGNWLGF